VIINVGEFDNHTVSHLQRFFFMKINGLITCMSVKWHSSRINQANW